MSSVSLNQRGRRIPPSSLAPKRDTDGHDITRIDAVIRNAKGIWFLLLGVMTFSAVTILGVEDVDFFAYDRATRLPLVGVEVPVTAFFGFGAALATAVYVYFHLYLELLWRALAKAPAQIQGEPLSEHIAPWLVSEWALRTRDRLRKAEAAERAAAPRALGWIGSMMSLALVWLLGPFVLAMFWWRSMPAHYDGMTFGLGLLFTFALFVGLRSARSAWGRLKDGHERGPARRVMRFAFGAAMSVCAIGISATSLITTASDWWPGEHAEWKDYGEGKEAADWISLYRQDLDHSAYWNKRWRDAGSFTDKWHYFADRAYTDFFSNLIIGADLAEAQLVALPRDWLSRAEAEKEFRAEWAKREGLAYRDPFPEIPEQNIEAEFQAALLEAREQANQTPDSDDEAPFDTTGFRNRWAAEKELPAATPFAPTEARRPEQEFEQAWSARRKTWLDTQAKPILTDRNLRRANLQGAFFPGVKLDNARLEGAHLFSARLEGANLFRARLEGAVLSDARLEDANLRGARLEGANLWYARLEGADLRYARLEGADLRYARLEGADLRNASLEGANLVGASLEGADLRSASLEGADLRNASLEGADLRSASLEGADLRSASLEGADLGGADLGGADLGGARLFGKAPGMLMLSQSATLRAANFTGSILRVADMAGINVAELKNFSQSFGDGSVTIAEEDRPAHWCKDVLSDAEFFGRWRGYVDPDGSSWQDNQFNDHPPIPPSPC